MDAAELYHRVHKAASPSPAVWGASAHHGLGGLDGKAFSFVKIRVSWSA